ncbi:MAG: hypothetical protein V3S52_09650, partial [Gemmatimonadota bacterium]
MARIFRLAIEAYPEFRRAEPSPRSGPGSGLLFGLFLLGGLFGGFSFGWLRRRFSFSFRLYLRGFRDGFFLRLSFRLGSLFGLGLGTFFHGYFLGRRFSLRLRRRFSFRLWLCRRYFLGRRFSL